MQEIIIEFIKIIPSILWFGVIITLLILFYTPLRNLLSNLNEFKALGVEMSFVKDTMDAALKLADKSPKWKVEVPQADRERVIARAKKHLHILKNAQILWIDDHPENNRNEMRMFQQLKAQVDTVTDTDAALAILKENKYDVILSDMARGDRSDAGVDFLQKFRRRDESTPVIFYVGVFDKKRGTPPQSFGITNRPDELLHLVLDALERKKY